MFSKCFRKCSRRSHIRVRVHLTHTCHILPPSEIDSGLCLAVLAGSGGKFLFHRIGWKGRIWQLCNTAPSAVAGVGEAHGGRLRGASPRSLPFCQYHIIIIISIIITIRITAMIVILIIFTLIMNRMFVGLRGAHGDLAEVVNTYIYIYIYIYVYIYI